MSKRTAFKQISNYCFIATMLLSVFACSPGMDEQQILQNAKGYLQQNKLKAAAIELQNVLQSNSNNAEARFLLGNINAQIGDLTTAEKDFRRAALAGWDPQQTQLALAGVLINSKQFKKLLDNIVIEDNWTTDTRADITALRALAEAGSNDPISAKATLQQAINYDEKAFQVLKVITMFQLAGIQNGAATETLQHALNLYPDNTELLLLLASDNLQNKDYSAAAANYKKIIVTKPNKFITASSHKAYLGLARLQIFQNKLEQAQSTLAPILKRNKNDTEANYLSSLISFSQGEYNTAEDYLRNLLAIMPGHAQSQQLMGKIKYALKEYEQASRYLSKYLKTAPGDSSVRLLLTQTYIDQNQSQEALSTLKPILADNPNDAMALSLFSQIAFIKGDLTEGITALKKAIKNNPENTALQKQLVKAFIASDDTEQALKELKTFQALSNDTVETQKLTISTYLKAGQINKAILVASEMADADPENPTIVALMGTLHAANNEPQTARNYFNKALQLQGNLSSAIIGLARLDKNAGKDEQAIALYKKLAQSNQGGTTPMLALAELAEQQKRTNDMLSWLEKSRSLYSSDIKSRIILANYYLRTSQPKNAELYIQEALKISPDYTELLSLNGRALMAQKRFNEALPPLKKLITRQPSSINAMLLLGETYLRLNKTAKARQHLQAALKKQQDNMRATLLLAEIEFRVGNYESSLAYAVNLQKTQPTLATGYLLEGNIWLARKEYKNAQLAYNKAWQRQPTAELAKRLFAAGKHTANNEDAIKPTLTWLKQNPRDISTRLFLAAYYQSEKANKQAIREYETVLKMSADNSAALNNLAWLYSLVNDPRALDMAERAYRTAPADAGIQDTYGWVLTQQGQPEKGLNLIKQAAIILPKNPDIRFHYASALIKTGNSEKGKKMLNDILKENKPFESREQAKRLLQTTP